MSTRISPLKARHNLVEAIGVVAVYLDKIAPRLVCGLEECPILDEPLDEDAELDDTQLGEFIPRYDLATRWNDLLEAYANNDDVRTLEWFLEDIRGYQKTARQDRTGVIERDIRDALVPTIAQVLEAKSSELGKLYVDYIIILDKALRFDITPMGLEEYERYKSSKEQLKELNKIYLNVSGYYLDLVDEDGELSSESKGQEMEELETIKKELESKAQALAEALGRIAELEQELAGLQAELEDATEEELDEGVDTPYTYIARQTKDRNRRMGMLVAIIERAEGAGLLEKQMNTQRLKWSEDFNNTQIAYFVARANSLLGIKAKRYKATNWGVWCRLIDGLKSTQLSQGKTDYTRQDEDGKPDNYELIDGLFVSL